MQTEIVSYVAEINPLLAEQWLKTSKGNRQLNRARLTEYIESMKSGLWRVTDQGIGFDAEGRLINGHHRLTAIIASGVTIKSLVVMGLAQDAARFIDIGAGRTPGHVLGMVYGIPSPKNVAAVARIWCALADNRAITSKREPEIWAALYRLNPKSFDFANRHHDMAAAAYVGVIAFAYSIAPLVVSEFASKVRTKIGIEANSPEAAMVNALARKEVRKPGGSAQQTLMQLTATAVYYKLRGEPISILKQNETAAEWLRAARKVDL